jgi:adenylosuccinate lyase
MDAWTNNKDYKTLLEASADVTNKLSKAELDDCFTLDYYFKNVDEIFRRVGIA